MTIIRRVVIAFTLVLAIVLYWAHWSSSVENVIRPVSLLPSDFHLKSKREEFGKQPILLVVDMKDSNVYSRYVAEILKTEGIVCFETVDISTFTIDSALLSHHSLVITAGASNALQSHNAQLTNYVQAGGSLLMIAPPGGFDSLLRVRDLHRTIQDRYVLFDSASSLTAGLAHIPLQFFGNASLYESAEAEIVARLVDLNDPSNSHVAVGRSTYGKGRTGFIAYDLGQSIVFTRQGKPPVDSHPHAVDKDGDGVFKTTDLYYDSFDYVNREIPQADEQQKLFVNLIFSLLHGTDVVPRIWYFPNEAPAIALLTGDHHGWTSEKPMPEIVSWIENAGGHCSFFIYPDQIDSPLVRTLAAQGHTINPHLYYPSVSNRVMRARLLFKNWFSSTSFFRPQLGDVQSEIVRGEETFEQFRLGRGRSNRFHYLVWWGWTETPQLLAQHGYRMDLSITGGDPRYAERLEVINHWNSPMGYGYINGSGQPMKVMTREGALINLFCQLTQFEDDVAVREVIIMPPDDSVTTRRLIALSREFIDQSIAQYHTALVWNFHPEHTIQRWPPEAPTTGLWIQATVKHLKDRNIPMLSVGEWLQFVEARRAISLNQVTYNPSTQVGGFNIVCPTNIDGVTFAIPLQSHALASLEVFSHETISSPPVTVQVINGLKYAVFRTDLQPDQPARVSFRFK
ncbi:MAG: hypothetical protein HW412_348 [Bacteroidetes bacterium]|nr:hypothetical protein [Bacteroidota bacterium]